MLVRYRDLPVVDMRVVDPAGFKAMIITIWDYDKLGDDFIGALQAAARDVFRRHSAWAARCLGCPWHRIGITRMCPCKERFTYCSMWKTAPPAPPFGA